MKKYLSYIFFICIIIITYFTYNKEKEIVYIEKEIEIKEEIKENSIYVDVKGAVKRPGVYEFYEGQRVIDAIKKSGGTTINAKTELLNLSKLLTDQMVIFVYSFEEEKITCPEIISCPIPNCEIPTNDACIDDQEDKISLNYATKEQLQTLPGIGESKAIDIINYRKNTPFKVIEDLMKVSGIGETTFNKLKDLIKI